MWLVAGLGNPGKRYESTRHNAGFLVIDELARRKGVELEEDEDSLSARYKIDRTDIILLKPLTYMNLSGTAVKRVLKRFDIPSENLIVVHDDIDMDTGKIRIKRSGSSGGHKGVESIISSTGSREFIRVKIGIGRDKEIPVEDYVLSKFKKEELPLIRDAVSRAADSVITIITEGIDKAMNKFNRP